MVDRHLASPRLRTRLAPLAACLLLATIGSPVRGQDYLRVLELVKESRARRESLVDTTPPGPVAIPVTREAVAGEVPAPAEDGTRSAWNRPPRPDVVAADRITFVDGTVVPGKVVSIKGGTLVFSAWKSAAIEAAFEEVTELSSKDQRYELALTDGSVVLGTLAETGESGTLGLLTANGLAAFPRESIRGLVTTEAAAARRAVEAEERRFALKKVWKGHGDLAFSESTGNTELRSLAVSAEATRTTPKDKLRVAALTTNARNAGVKSAQKSQGSARLDINLHDDTFYFFQGQLENDKLRSLDLRTTLGAGFGKRWHLPDGGELALGLGYSFVREAFASGLSNSEGTLLTTVDLTRTLGRNLKLEHHLTAYPKTDGDFRANASTSFASKISDDLSFTLGFLNVYDSEPPVGTDKSDFTVTTGLRKDF